MKLSGKEIQCLITVLRSHWLAGKMDPSKQDDDDDGKLILSLEKKLRSTIQTYEGSIELQ